MNRPGARTDSTYTISRYTGEFVCGATEEEFIRFSWPVLSKRLLIALLLCSCTFLFANLIPRPGFYPEYRVIIIPLSRVFAGLLLVIALIVKKSRHYSTLLRVLMVLSEIILGLLETADHYFFLRFINRFYDIGTSFLVFYILIFYIVIPNRVRLTFFTNLGLSITFIIITALSGTTVFSDLFSITMYFFIANCLGYGILLTTNKSKREEYYHGIRLKEEIAHRRRAEKKAEEAKRLAEEADKAKSRFLAIMNHEMRTPLNVVIGGIQILERNYLASEQRETVSLIRNSGELLKGLIQNVLDFSNIERNRLQIKAARFSLKQMIEEIDSIYSRMAEEKGLDFSTTCGFSSIDYVIGDALRLRQIVTNLLNNAMKFTEKGAISLSVDLLKREGNQILLRFEATDTGIGISEKHFVYIQKPFTQVEQSAARSFDGSGLGLAICSELLNAMDSRLEIVSREGAGSTFSFTLSLAIDDAESPEAEETAMDSCRILLIDDIEANLKIVGGLLEALNQRVVYAQGSRQGIEKSRTDDFDAVIIDLHMPGKDGMATIREIRTLQPKAAAFLMTADTREEVFAELQKEGFTDFIPKPVDISQLKDCLGKLGANNSVTNGNMAVSEDPVEILDKGFIRDLRDDLGDEVSIDVIKSCIEALENGAAKIREPGSIDDLEDIIHQLKGVAGNYRLMQLWKALEGYKDDRAAFDCSQLTEILEESIGELKEAISFP